MTPTFTLSADEQLISRKLERRDRNALLLYGLSGLVVVVVEEVVAFHFHMADRFGFAPPSRQGRGLPDSEHGIVGNAAARQPAHGVQINAQKTAEPRVCTACLR